MSDFQQVRLSQMSGPRDTAADVPSHDRLTRFIDAELTTFQATFRACSVDTDISKNPMAFWSAGDSGSFPHLAVLAPYVFRTSSSAQSERFYSTLGCIITEDRTSLGPETISNMVVSMACPMLRFRLQRVTGGRRDPDEAWWAALHRR